MAFYTAMEIFGSPLVDVCVSSCVCDKLKNYAAHTWHHSIHVGLFGRSSCSPSSAKELHDAARLNKTIMRALL